MLHFNIQQIQLTHFANGFRIDNKSTTAARSSDCYTLIVCHSFKIYIFYWTEQFSHLLFALIKGNDRPRRLLLCWKIVIKRADITLLYKATVGVSAIIQCRRSWLQYCLPDQENGQYCSLQLYHPIYGMHPFI